MDCSLHFLRVSQHGANEGICSVKFGSIPCTTGSLLNVCRRNLLYLASIGAVLYFFFGILEISSESIPIYIPICTVVGVALAISLEYKWEQLKHSIRMFLRCIGTWLAGVTPNSEVDSLVLPLYNVRHPPEPPPPRSQTRLLVIGTSGRA